MAERTTQDHPQQPAKPTKAESAETERNDRAGMSGAVVPPDPPIASSVTDAEAAGTPPSEWQRRTDPDSGPRTRTAYTVAESPIDQKPHVARGGLMVGLALIIGLAAAALFMALSWNIP